MNSYPDKQKDLILKIFTQLLIKPIFSRLALLWTFSHILQCLPLPRLLHVTGYWYIFMISTWYEFRTFSSFTDSQNSVNPSSPSLTPLFSHSILHFWILYICCFHFCHQRFAKFWNFFLSLQKACITSQSKFNSHIAAQMEIKPLLQLFQYI